MLSTHRLKNRRDNSRYNSNSVPISEKGRTGKVDTKMSTELKKNSDNLYSNASFGGGGRGGGNDRDSGRSRFSSRNVCSASIVTATVGEAVVIGSPVPQVKVVAGAVTIAAIAVGAVACTMADSKDALYG